MDWKRIVDAADGRPQSLAWIVDQPSADVAALATLLLLEEAPHPAAALVAAAAWRGNSAPPIQAALAPHVAPALAAWRADPHWAERAIGDRARLELPWGVAVMSGALRDRPAAQHDAVAVVLRCGDSDAVVRCLAALGADGWRALGDDLRAALLAQAPAPALGRVWDALDEARRAAAAQRAAATPGDAARLIGSIGAAAWDATDRALRRRLIDAAVRDPVMMVHTARAWAGMTDDEHERLIAAATAHAKAWNALDLLSALGAAGRATLAAKQRAALDALALEHPDAWRVLAWRAADAGWRALTGDARAAVLAAAQRDGRNVPLLLRAIDGAGWRAMDDRERGRLAAVVHRAPDALFSCPPTLWRDLVGADLPRATEIPQVAIAHWRPEDAAADLGALPPTHQAVVLALAPWRTEDAASDSARMQRLRAAWNALTADARVALATTHPLVLAPVAAAARLGGGSVAALDAVGVTVARQAAGIDNAAACIVGAMLRTPDRWRAWMASFAPTAGDPPEAWAAWEGAVPPPPGTVMGDAGGARRRAVCGAHAQRHHAGGARAATGGCHGLGRHHRCNDWTGGGAQPHRQARNPR